MLPYIATSHSYTLPACFFRWYMFFAHLSQLFGRKPNSMKSVMRADQSLLAKWMVAEIMASLSR